MKTFFWYDYETFGRHPAWDRIAQFGGIRTDDDLNIIGKPILKYCKLYDDCLPQPGACLVTGITPQITAQKGISEMRLAEIINRELSEPDTCCIGYNNVSFDDEFTRNILYRNFYDPFGPQNVRSNSRWDLIDVVRLMRALRPDGIIWPTKDDGSFSTKLEHLTAANGIVHDAHDALADVKATIEIAKLIRTNNSKLYEYVFEKRSKSEARKLLCVGEKSNRVQDPKPLLYVSSVFSTERNCISIVLPVAVSAERSNDIIVVDLLADLKPLLELESTKAVRDRVFTANADLLPGEQRVPIHCINVGRCPVLVELNALRPNDIERLNFDMGLCETNIKLVQQCSDIEIVARHIYGPYQNYDRDPELAIYDRFLSLEEKAQLPEIREATPQELKKIKCEDKRMAELLFRYRARNFFDTLSRSERERWKEYRTNRLTVPIQIKKNQESLILETYFRELNEKLNDTQVTEHDSFILGKLQEYGAKLERSLAAKVRV